MMKENFTKQIILIDCIALVAMVPYQYLQYHYFL